MDNRLIKMNAAFKPLFKKQRYKVYYGGRGGGKSWGISIALLILGAQNKLRILCTREVQKSIRDSVHKLLSDCVSKFKLETFYRITREGIYGANGTEFLFHGLKHSVQTIKSLEGVDICWVEEAQKIPNESWEVLIPTIRKTGSEIWLSFNPNLATDPTYTRFLNEPVRENQLTVKVSYRDNLYFSDELKKEMEYQKEIDYNDYLHIWEGHCKTSTDAQIFKGKYIVETFDTPDTDNVVFYFGKDWGFSQDPNALVRCFIVDKELFIDYEAGGVGIELEDISKVIDSVPGAKENVIRADNSRPETISYVKRQGYRIEPVYKWAGSVEDGIAFIRSFRQVHIHTRCFNTANEFLLYNYKTDKLTSNILTTIIDKHNHYIDALRYGLQPLIKQRGKMTTMPIIGAY
jgi:phage terminase large subunit